MEATSRRPWAQVINLRDPTDPESRRLLSQIRDKKTERACHDPLRLMKFLMPGCRESLLDQFDAAVFGPTILCVVGGDWRELAAAVRRKA